MNKLISISNTILSNNTGLDAITRAPIVDYETPYRCLRIQNVSHEENFEKWGYTEVSKDNYINYQLHKDDIIISRTGGSVGTLMYIDKDYSAVYNNGLIRLVVNKEEYNPLYIYYCLKLDAFKKHIEKCSLGNSTQENIRMNDMLEYKIPDYSLDVQNKIVFILSILDQRIKNNRIINTELESMAKTIYDYWFLQFDFPDENEKPYKSSGGKMVWNEELKRDIPEGWKCDMLREYVSLTKGISYTSKNIESGKGVPMINLASIDINRNYKPNELKYYDGEYNCRKEVSSEDMLIACTDLTRNANIVGSPILVPNIDETYLYSMDLAKLDLVTEELEPMYLYMTLRTEYYHNYIKGFATGTNVMHLNTNGISWFRVCFPPIKIQKKFSLLVKEIHKMKCKLIKENQELTALRDFLLPLLMNGQVGFK